MKTRILSVTFLWFITGPAGAARAADEIRDVRPPVEMPWGLWPLFLLAVAAAVLLIVGLVRYLSARRRTTASVPPPVPAWESAYQRLEALRVRNLPAQGAVEPYYTELSDIIRRYVEARFDIQAPEMTTEEFLLALRSGTVLNARQKECLRDFLTCSDMVKFARYSSSEPEMEDSFLLARRFVEETRGDHVSVSPGGGGA